MNQITLLHLYPVFSLVVLVYLVMFLMGFRRFAAIKNGLPPSYFKLFKKDGQTPPEDAELAARNFVNLFEMPVLFYALVALLIVTQKANSITLIFCWGFVLTRYLHTLIHVTKNKLFWRMRIYFTGTLLLLAGWVYFFFEVIQG